MSNRSSDQKAVIVLSNRSKRRLVWKSIVFLACIFKIVAIWIGFGYKSIYGVLIAIIGFCIFAAALLFYQSSKEENNK